jgi:hypothetical protein
MLNRQRHRWLAALAGALVIAVIGSACASYPRVGAPITHDRFDRR